MSVSPKVVDDSHLTRQPARDDSKSGKLRNKLYR